MKRTIPPRAVQARHERMKAAIFNLDAIKAERCKRSLFYFMKEFWSEISNEEFHSNWHIEHVFCPELETIARHVAQGQAKEYDLVVNVPPGTTKTITFSIMFPVWCWIRWYWMRFITGSYSGALSLESAEYSRDLVRSEKFRRYFPELQIKQDKDTKSNFRVQKRLSDGSIQQGGSRYSTSVGGTATGFHGHILLIDDPLNPEQAVSETELRTANRWVDRTLSTRKVDKAVTVTILVMQRLHEDDPSGHLLNKKKNVRHICLPGEIQHYKEFVRPTELVKHYTDDLLDPVRMNWTVLRDMEADLGQYGYAGQVGQRPTPPGGGMFQVDNMSIIDRLPAEVNFVETVRYWDKAGTQGGGAFTAGCKISKLRDGKYLVHDMKRGQWATNIREAIIKATAEADDQERRTQVYVEQEPGSGGKESAESTIRNLTGHSVYRDLPRGDKFFRADPFSVQVNNGNVLLLRGDWNHDFIEEHRSFPFSTYKDQVDAASGAAAQLMHKKKAGPLLRAKK